MDAIENLLEKLEPEAGNFDHDRQLQVSIAVSLKRIADVLSDPNAYGEIGASAISGAIVRGLRNV